MADEVLPFQRHFRKQKAITFRKSEAARMAALYLINRGQTFSLEPLGDDWWELITDYQLDLTTLKGILDNI